MKAYNRMRNPAFCIGMTVVGLISLIFGVVWARMLPEEANNLSMVSGMLSGMGGAFAFLGIFWLARLKLVSPQKLKLEQIEQNDERNVQIRHKAYTIASNAATLIFAILAFVFIWMDDRVPGLICIAAMYLHFMIFLIASRILSRRM